MFTAKLFQMAFPPTDTFSCDTDVQQPSRILIVEDHKITSRGYEIILKNAAENNALPQLTIKKSDSLESAYRDLFLDGEHHEFFDIVFLDIRMAPYPERELFSGEDLGKLIRVRAEQMKLVVITSIINAHRLKSILESLKPQGFLIKTEITEKMLVEAVQQVLQQNSFFSPEILNVIRNNYFSDITLDNEQKQFLYLLSVGVASKNICEHLPWSPSKVEKQKRLLREKLEVSEKSVFALVHKAKKLGII